MDQPTGESFKGKDALDKHLQDALEDARAKAPHIVWSGRIVRGSHVELKAEPKN